MTAVRFRVAAAVLLTMAFSAGTDSSHAASPSTRADRSLRTLDGSASFNGDWDLHTDRSDERLDLGLKRSWHRGNSTHSWSWSSDVALDELHGITRAQIDGDDAEVEFTLPRDAGVFRMSGRVHRGHGAGEFTFEPDRDFLVELRRVVPEEPTLDDLARFAANKLGRDWLRAYAKRGYHDISADALARLAIHGVSPDYLEAMNALGYRHPDVDDLIRLRVHGVEPEFVRELGSLGYAEVPVDELVRLKVHGVTPDFVHEMLDLGYARPTTDELTRLRIHGVDEQYLREVSKLVEPRPSADELARMKISGIDVGFIRRAHARHRELSADELIHLKRRGDSD